MTQGALPRSVTVQRSASDRSPTYGGQRGYTLAHLDQRDLSMWADSLGFVDAASDVERDAVAALCVPPRLGDRRRVVHGLVARSAVADPIAIGRLSLPHSLGHWSSNTTGQRSTGGRATRMRHGMSIDAASARSRLASASQRGLSGAPTAISCWPPIAVRVSAALLRFTRARAIGLDVRSGHVVCDLLVRSCGGMLAPRRAR